MSSKRFLSFMFFIVLYGTLFGCNNPAESFVSDITRLGVVPAEGKTYIVIPGKGCSTCIGYARDFIRNNFDADNFVFILTEFDSKKELNMIYGREILNQNNVLIDDENYFNSNAYYSMYPTIFSIDKNTTHLYADTYNTEVWRGLVN